MGRHKDNPVYYAEKVVNDLPITIEDIKLIEFYKAELLASIEHFPPQYSNGGTNYTKIEKIHKEYKEVDNWLKKQWTLFAQTNYKVA